jgi:hypothetical protein
MPPRAWPHLMIAVLAAILLGLATLSYEDPHLQNVRTIHDEERQCWSVSGDLVYPSSGTLSYPGGKAKLVERIVPFSFLFFESSATNPTGSDSDVVLQLAIAASAGKSGRRNLNGPALAGGWLVCWGTLWVGWWLIRSKKKGPGLTGNDGRGDREATSSG